MSKPEFVHALYIASTPETVFDALTDAKMSERYWHGNSLICDWKIGSSFTLRLARHEIDVTGELVEYDPPRRLAYSFRAHHGSDGGKASRVTFELEAQRDHVKLTLVHDCFEPASPLLKTVSAGWPLALSSLKSFVECGQVLHPPWYQEQPARSKLGVGADR